MVFAGLAFVCAVNQQHQPPPKQVIVHVQVYELKGSEKVKLANGGLVSSQVGDTDVVGGTGLGPAFQTQLDKRVSDNRAKIITGPRLRTLDGYTAFVTIPVPWSSRQLLLRIEPHVVTDGIGMTAELSDGSPGENRSARDFSWMVTTNGTETTNQRRVFMVNHAGRGVIVVVHTFQSDGLTLDDPAEASKVKK